MEQPIVQTSTVADWRTTKTWYTRQTLFARITLAALGLYYFPLLKIETRGLENIPDGACIMVANHISNDDPPILGLALRGRRYPFFMAKKELFERAEWAYRYLGAFPVYRGERDQWAFEHVGRVLAAGQMCVLFAEGSRAGRGKVQLRPAKTGAVRLALHYRVPLVPCALIGPEKLRHLRFKGWRPVTARVSIAPPVDVCALAPENPSKEDLHNLTTHVMRRLAALLPEENRGVYA
ncbi:MAG: 1-acyl-sn-glycerol-3-phosphate acyltransferase [Caldilineae bacterium]|nr:MAG: 1-acyl-sn-glycerol-3-phosphate acyltransferase [Caldilineae bacterium]